MITVFGIVELDAREADAAIAGLFAVLDKSGDGLISADDFMAWNDVDGAGTWQEFASHIGLNQAAGSLTLDEFAFRA